MNNHHRNYFINCIMTMIKLGDYIHIDGKTGIILNIDLDKNELTVRINGSEEIISMYDWPQFETITPGGSDDELRLKMAQAKFKHFTIRRARFVYEKIGHNNNKFFYGYTTANKLFNLEQSEANHLEYFSDSLYYQAGDCCKLRLDEGLIEFEDKTYNELNKIGRDSIMMGIAQFGDRGERYVKWCSAGNGRNRPLYYLYLLVIYGLEHNIFRNMKREQIMKLLENEIYQTYASVLIYKDDNTDLGKKIKANLQWAIDFRNHNDF